MSADLAQKSEVKAIQERIANLESTSFNQDPITLEKIQNILSEASTTNPLLSQAANWNSNTATGSAQLVHENIYVTGLAATGSLTATNTITLGNDLVLNAQTNSIETLSSPLRIQSLAMAPIEIMAGLFSINTTGDVNIKGNLYVAGNVEAQSLKVKAPNQSQEKLLEVLDTQDNSVATITSTGSAEFKSITADNFLIASTATSSSSAIVNGEITTNATAGEAVIPALQGEITIRNQKVKTQSLIYITPTSESENQVLYVKSKGDGFFKAGFKNPISQDTTFNWWIVDTRRN